MARAQQEFKAAKVSDPHSEQGHRILQHIYFPGWKHRPRLTQVRRALAVWVTRHRIAQHVEAGKAIIAVTEVTHDTGSLNLTDALFV